MVLIVVCIFLVMISLIFSKIQIEFINLEFISKEKVRKYDVIIKLYIWSIVPIFKMKLNPKILKKEKLKLKNLEEKVKVKDKKIFIEFFKKLKDIIKIKNLEVKIQLGVEDAAVTAILVGIISTILSYLLSVKIKKPQNQKYEVVPLYKETNLLKINFKGIFDVNMIHIIYIIYALVKKRRNFYVRTSNRGAYANSNE